MTIGLPVTVPSGTTTVPTLAALEAYNPSNGFVFLTEIYRGGLFNWISGVFTNQVTNDPGKGVYVAWSGDASPGASGAWVRQWVDSVDWCWWGIVPDCTFTQDVNWNSTNVSGTDNYSAFVHWQTWARYQSSLGLGVKVTPSPGCYGWIQNNVAAGDVGGLYWTSGISKLHIDGRGMVIMQALTNGGYSFPIPSVATMTHSYLIAQTVVGATSVTLLTSSQAGNFSVGQKIMVGSLDVQYLGYPPNLQQYQFLTVVSANSSTGIITVKEPLLHQHMTTYPDYSYDESPAGAARVWVIGEGLGTQWDIDHIYEGLQVNLAPNGSPSYCQMTGRKIKTIDWVGVAFSESVAGNISHIRPSLKTNGEFDKLVEYCEYINPDMATSTLLLQSAAPRNMVIKGGAIYSIKGLGQQMDVEDCTINSLVPGCEFGQNFGSSFRNCRIVTATIGKVTDGVANTITLTIDGEAVTYSNGVITLNTTTLGFGINYWNCVPGMGVALQAESSGGYPGVLLYPGDLGFGLIENISYSSNSFTIQTTLPYATLPSWASANVYLFKTGPIQFDNCTGSDVVRLASIANSDKFRYFEYWKQIIAGIPPGGGIVHSVNGTLTSVRCNVKNAGSNPNTVFQVSFQTFNSASNYASDFYTIVNFNVGVIGDRTATTSGFSGAVGTDNITVNNVTQSSLPSNRVAIVAGAVYTLDAPTQTVDAPLFELTIQLSGGLARGIVTTYYFGDISSVPLISFQGSPQ